MNHQRLLWNMHCVATVVLRKQLNFKSAVIRSNRSSCLPSAAFIAQRLVGSANNWNKYFKFLTMLRILTGRRQTSWLFTSVAEDLNSELLTVKQILVVARTGVEPGTAGLQFWRADHSAMLPCFNQIGYEVCKSHKILWSSMLYKL